MEDRLDLHLQPRGCHRLGDSVRDSGHPEHPNPVAVLLRYLHRFDRRREVAPRGHPIPDPVEVVLQVLLELLDQ
jgi:hypothetical protein